MSPFIRRAVSSLHFVYTRVRESRKVAAEPEWAAADGTDWPMPSRELAFAVAGSSRMDVFVDGGRKAASTLESAVSASGQSLADVQPVLDLGCGCGRVLRHLPRSLELHGVDADADAIEWCRQSYTGFRFQHVMPEKPLPFTDGRFGLIYAFSVFTHIQIEAQRLLVQELHRLLRTGGLAIISVHGASYEDKLSAPEREALAREGCVIRGSSLANSNYCNAFHRAEYVTGELFRCMELVEFRPQGALGNPHQDLLIFRRP